MFLKSDWIFLEGNQNTVSHLQIQVYINLIWNHSDINENNIKSSLYFITAYHLRHIVLANIPFKSGKITRN